MYVGIDYHKRYSVATKMDEHGEVMERMTLRNDPETLQGYAATLPAGSQIALEATGSWYYFYEVLEDSGHDIHLAHPLKTRAIAEARIKTDTIDATMLAHLLRTNLLPRSYIAPRHIRDLREILRYRASLVSMRVSVKNRIHALLSKNGSIVPYSDVLGTKARRYLANLPLRDSYRQCLEGYLQAAQALTGLIKEVDTTITSIAEDNDQAMRLTTIPGIGYFSALLILSEIGEVQRFSSAKKLCSYAGLVPRVHSSGGKTRYGSITKQGSKWLRWILVETSTHYVNSCPRLKRLYETVAHRHGKHTARVAVARQMLTIIYCMLRDHRDFVRG